MIRVDVAIPCYGYAHFLQTAVASVLMQRNAEVRVLRGIESFVVSSLHLTKRIMRRFWNTPPGSGGSGDRAKFP
jgi:hypothetical protein